MERGARRQVPRKAPAFAYLLQEEIFHVSAGREECTVWPWIARKRSHPCQLSQITGNAQSEGRKPGGVGVEPLWAPPVRDFFQDLHRESLGSTMHHHPRGVGSAT